MPKMRVVSNNAADVCGVTSSTTAGAHVAANLLTDDKTTWARSTGTEWAIKGVGTTLLGASCVHLPFCNLSPAALWRIRLTQEDVTTNLLSRSEDFANAAWLKTSSGTGSMPVVVSNSVAAPDGTVSADTITFNSGAGASAADFSMIAHAVDFAVEPGALYAGSIFFKGTPGVQILMRNVGGVAFTKITFDGSWQRYNVSETAGSANFEFGVRQEVAGSMNPTVTVAVWGAQLERNDVASSYYPTGATPATRPLGYIDSWQSYAFDSGLELACPAPARVPRGWTQAQAASAYANGGGAHARIYFDPTNFVGFSVDISDEANAQGYIEAARLVVGAYWQPEYNASAATLSPQDSTVFYESAAGSRLARAGSKRRQLEINLSFMSAADRARMIDLLMDSTSYPILVSLFPEDVDLALERDNTVYGRLANDADVSYVNANVYATKIAVLEI